MTSSVLVKRWFTFSKRINRDNAKNINTILLAKALKMPIRNKNSLSRIFFAVQAISF
jgi:hypothetical protein